MVVVSDEDTSDDSSVITLYPNDDYAGTSQNAADSSQSAPLLLTEGEVEVILRKSPSGTNKTSRRKKRTLHERQSCESTGNLPLGLSAPCQAIDDNENGPHSIKSCTVETKSDSNRSLQLPTIDEDAVQNNEDAHFYLSCHNTATTCSDEDDNQYGLDRFVSMDAESHTTKDEMKLTQEECLVMLKEYRVNARQEKEKKQRRSHRNQKQQQQETMSSETSSTSSSFPSIVPLQQQPKHPNSLDNNHGFGYEDYQQYEDNDDASGIFYDINLCNSRDKINNRKKVWVKGIAPWNLIFKYCPKVQKGKVYFVAYFVLYVVLLIIAFVGINKFLEPESAQYINEDDDADKLINIVPSIEFTPIYINMGHSVDQQYLGPIHNQTWVSDVSYILNESVVTSYEYQGCSDMDFVSTITTEWNCQLFCSERYSLDYIIRYELPVLASPAYYVIKMYFNELYYNSSDERLFDIVIEDEVALLNFDIFQEATEKYTVVIVETVQHVSDGKIAIELIPVKCEAKINALEVLFLSFNEVNATLNITTIEAPTRLSNDNKNSSDTVINITEQNDSNGQLPIPSINSSEVSSNSPTPLAPEVFNNQELDCMKGPVITNLENKTKSIFINAGQELLPLYTSGDGSIWYTDSFYIASSEDKGYTYDLCPLWIVNLDFDDRNRKIACSERVFDSIGKYEIPVPEPSTKTTQYSYKLHFAELYFDEPNARIFDVVIEGVTVRTNLDVWKESGGKFMAYTVSGEVSVLDSGITIQLVPVVQQAIINAIEVHPIYITS
jgi:Malectin domain